MALQDGPKDTTGHVDGEGVTPVVEASQAHPGGSLVSSDSSTRAEPHEADGGHEPPSSSSSDDEDQVQEACPKWAQNLILQLATQAGKAKRRQSEALDQMVKVFSDSQEAAQRHKIPKAPTYSVQKLKLEATVGEVEDWIAGIIEVNATMAPGQPDRYYVVVSACRKIFALAQTGTCAAYYSDFVSLTSQLGWTETKILIALFERNLKDHVKDILAQKAKDVPKDTLEAFAMYCTAVDNSIYARHIERKTSRYNPGPRAAQHISVPRPMPTLPTGDPMDLDSVSMPFRYNQNGTTAWGICWRCGSPDHVARSCAKRHKAAIKQATLQSDDEDSKN
ncbi:hypothetical protein BROUX41_006720 [Berkeleyomyces rouxiae]